MTLHKAPEVDTSSLAASRTQHMNAGVPPHNFEAVTEQLELRLKQAEKDAKVSAAPEIEANPFTGDDSLACTDLPDFFPPTLTGDSEVDTANYRE